MTPVRFVILVGRLSAASSVVLVALLLPLGGIEWPPTLRGLAALAAFAVGFGLLIAALEVAMGHHRELPAPAAEEPDENWATLRVERRNGHQRSRLRSGERER